MLFNIAVNTIITIMVFFFPGILSRWAFFSNINQQAKYHSAPLERIAYSLIWSISNIFIFVWILDSPIYGQSNYFNPFDYNVTVCFLNNLWDNNFPVILNTLDGFYRTTKYLIGLYFSSILLGWILQKLIHLFKLDYYFNTLRFKSEWIYLFSHTPKLKVKRSIFQKYNVRIDLLDTENKLFQGYFYRTIFSSDNKLDAIVLKNAFEFVNLKNDKDKDKILSIKNSHLSSESYTLYKEDQYRTVFKRNILGELLVIKFENIKNINLLFIKDINSQYKRTKRLSNFIIYLLYTIIFILLPFAIWFILKSNDSPYFITLFRRLIMAFITYFNVYFVTMYFIQKVIKEKSKQNLTLPILLSILLSLSSIYLWIFNIFNFWKTLLTFISIVFFLIFTAAAFKIYKENKS